MTRPCPACGKENSTGAKACVSCGHPLSPTRHWLTTLNPLTTGLVVALVLAGVFGYVEHNRAERLAGQLADLQTQNAALQKKYDDLSASDQSLKAGAADLARVTGLLGNVLQQFNDLDNLVTSSDAQANDLIRWYVTTAKFDTTNGDLDQANERYGAFVAQHQQTVTEYDNIKTTFTQTIDQLDALLGVPASSPSTGL